MIKASAEQKIVIFNALPAARLLCFHSPHSGSVGVKSHECGTFFFLNVLYQLLRLLVCLRSPSIFLPSLDPLMLSLSHTHI